MPQPKDDGGSNMQRLIWGTVYCLIGAGLIGAAVLLGAGIATNRTSLGLAGVTCSLVSLSAAHFLYLGRWLKVRRAKVESMSETVTRETAANDMRRVLMTGEFFRATRALEDAAQAGREGLAAEREELLADVEQLKDAYKTEGFKLGYETAERGVAPDAPSNVLHFPLGPSHATTMGQGALYN